MTSRLRWYLGAIACLCLWLLATPAGAADPLPSWQEGPSKRAIIAFVTAVTREGAPTYAPPVKRVAVFDNDGTLWTEQLMYNQLAFAIDRLKALAPRHPDWRVNEPFRSVLAGDVEALAQDGERAAVELITATHAGMTTDEFDAIVREWIATARHPRTGRRYTEMVYQPMLELLAYLRQKGFSTWIVSGGGVDFMRPWVQRVYGVPPSQTIGSEIALRYEIRAGRPVLVREAKIAFIDDEGGKPVAIERVIGRRPIFAFGNSDGDQQMLEWTMAGDGPRFAGLVHHTDARREWAYDRDSAIGRLDKAWNEAVRRGWTVVNMKTEWKRIYPFER